MKNRFALLLAVVMISGIMPASAWAVDRDVTTTCPSPLANPCYATLTAAVAASSGGDVIYVFPGTYNEDVDLAGINGDITIIGVDAAGNTVPGNAGDVIISSSVLAPLACFGGGTFNGDITVNGLSLTNTSGTTDDDDRCGLVFEEMTGDITLIDVIATSSSWDGIALYDITGDVSLTDCTGQDAYDDGIDVNGCTGDVTMAGCDGNTNGDNGFHLEDIDSDVTITDCDGNNNEDNGFYLNDIHGTVRFTDCNGNSNKSDGFDVDDDVGIVGNLFMAGCTANGNYNSGDDDEDGFDLYVTGNIELDDCSANNNGQEGIDIELCTGSATIANSSATSNGGEGIDIDRTGIIIYITYCEVANNTGEGIEVAENQVPLGDVIISCCDITGNGLGGMALYQNVTVNAENNYWGSANGPTHPLNPGGTGDSALDSTDGDPDYKGTLDYTPWLTDNFTESCEADEPDPYNIPTTTPLGLALMVLLLSGAAFWFIKKRRKG